MQPVGSNQFTPPLNLNQNEESFDLHSFIQNLPAEPEEAIQRILTNFFNEDNIVEATKSIITLFDSHTPLADKTQIFNLFIQNFPHKYLCSLIHSLTKEIPPEIIAKIFTYIEDPIMVKFFCFEFVKYTFDSYLENPKNIDREIDALLKDLEYSAENRDATLPRINKKLPGIFQRFIEGVSDTIDYERPEISLVLTSVLEHLENLDLMHCIISENFENYDQFEQLCILVNFSPASLYTFIQTFNTHSNPYKLPFLLDTLFWQKKSHRGKVAMVQNFLEPLSSNELHHFTTVAIDLNARFIPYIFIALPEEEFNELCLESSETFISKLLRESLSNLNCVTQWVLQDLEDKERIPILCNQVELDILSQNFEIINGMAYAFQLTLMEACEYIEENADDLENFMNDFQEDLNQIPPFLLAIGMRVPEYRQAILRVRIFLSEEQLIGITRSLQSKDYEEILETFLTNIRVDQMQIIIKNLYFKFFDAHIAKLAKSISKKMKSIDEVQDQLKITFQKRITDKKEYLKAEKKTLQQMAYLNAILTPLNDQLKVRADLCKKTPLFSEIMSNCKVMLNEIEGLGGFYEKLNKWEPEKEAESTSFLKAIEIKGDITIKDLAHFGIYSDKDCELFDFEVEEYLSQDNLKEIWIFFKTKHLTSIQTLFEYCCVENKEEIMNLELVAKKLGFMLKIN